MLVARHTSERYVLGPLVHRIRTAVVAGVQTTLTSLSESTVASSVLGDTRLETLRTPPDPPFEIMSLRSEAETECDRIASLRRLARRRPPSSGLPWPGTAIYLTHGRTDIVTIVLRVRVEIGGTTVEDSLLPILSTCGFGAVPGSRRRLRGLVGELARQLEQQLLASPDVMKKVRQSELSIVQALSTLATRESRLAASYADRHENIQPGLFDRRAVRRAEAQERAAAQLMDETQTRLGGLAQIDLRPAFEIVAIHPGWWPEP
jgi:hypothetical protein